MKRNKSKSILLLLIISVMIFHNFNCCTTTSCLKRTMEWDDYSPSDFFDNTIIMDSKEFKSLQLKHPISETEIDNYSKKISPELTKWFTDYDSIFQGNSEIIAKLRINSNGLLENLRTMNTFKFDTNRINILKNNVKNIRFKTWSDTMVQAEFIIKVSKELKGINILKIDRSYSVIGKRTKEEIMKFVNSNLKPLNRAFQTELNNNFCAHGKITVRFVLREDGTIPICKVIESSYCDTTFESKLITLITNWKFPPMITTYDITEIVYPFIFNRE